VTDKAVVRSEPSESVLTINANVDDQRRRVSWPLSLARLAWVILEKYDILVQHGRRCGSVSCKLDLVFVGG
jgi:hypothetical protein